MDWRECPDCGARLRPAHDVCPRCRLPLTDPLAAELSRITADLRKIDDRRARLANRRDELKARLRVVAAEGGPPSGGEEADPAAGGSGEAPYGPPRGDASGGGRRRPGVPHARRWREAGRRRADESGEQPPGRNRRPGAARAPSGTRAAAGSSSARAGGGGDGPRRDLSHHAAQNLLLLLGGVLLSIAAVVFTLVNWDIPVRRAGILAVVTAGMLAAPWLLARRRLAATAETVALVGLVLMPLDGIAIAEVFAGGSPTGVPGEPPGTVPGSVALAATVITILWGGYGLIAPLRLPRPTAIVLAQTPLPLTALAGGGTATGMALALVGTSALDLLLWRKARSPAARLEKIIAGAVGALTGLAGVGLAITASIRVNTLGDALRVSGVLVVAAFLAVAWAGVVRRSYRPAPARSARPGPEPPADRARRPSARRGGTIIALIAAVASMALIAALAAPFTVMTSPVWASDAPERAVPSPGWTMAAYAGAGYAVLVLGRRLPPFLRTGVTAASVVVLAVTGCLALPEIVSIVLLPLDWMTAPWRGAPTDWDGPPGAPVVMAVLALACLRGYLLIESVRGDPPAKAGGSTPGAAPGVTPMPGGAAVAGSYGAPVAEVAGHAGVPLPWATTAWENRRARLLTIVPENRPDAGGLRPWRVPTPDPGTRPAATVLRILTLAFATMAAIAFPVAAGLPYAFVLVVLYGVAVALLGPIGLVQVKTLAVHRTVVALGAGATVLAVAWSLAERAATLPMAVAVFALLGFGAIMARTVAAQVVTGAGAVLAAGGVMAATALTFGWPLVLGALILLAVRAVTLIRLRLPRRVRLASARIRAPLPAVPAARTGQWVALEAAAMVVSYAALAFAASAEILAPALAVNALLAAFGSRNRSGRWRTVAIVEAYALAASAASAALVGAVPLLTTLAGPHRWLSGAWLEGPPAGEAAASDAALPATPIMLSVLLLAAAVAAVVVTVTHRRPALGGARPARSGRRTALWSGLALAQIGLWIWLFRSGVTVPEAYTVTLSAAGLVIGHRARRADPALSSWRAYGVALTPTFAVSLVAAADDPGFVRSLLLGAVALVVTLAGARARLQAPLLTGGITLIVIAAQELAPAIAELLERGPRWLPIALAGAVLLFTGATYERRMRDLRRMRRIIGCMR